jgi:hypothetical protein
MIYIPITFDCSGANHLRDNNLRENAYPFDWNIKTLDSIYLLIKNNFQDLFKKEYLMYGNNTFFNKYDNNKHSVASLIPVYNTHYKILFVHDFSDTSEENLIKIKDKYIKRIDRFNTTVQSNQEISFVYSNEDRIYRKSIYDEWIKYFDDKNIF